MKKAREEIIVKEQDIISLNNKISLLEAEVERGEKKINDLKSAKEEEESTSNTTEALQRKISLLENELDNTEKNLKETTEK